MANRLIDEQSPYLQQHAHNPVDWYPWGDEPFERAKAEDKPVLVSIGYAACHWCHVMERESFESAEVAAYMNEHFICIKVDREEHPDVDHLYMDAVQAISGSGGWPLNVFVTPERLPFYGGTYYPPRPAFNRPSWVQLLQRMNEIWTTERSEVDAQSGQMVQYLQQASRIGLAAQGMEANMDTARSMADTLLKQADTLHGGFGQAPKFPGTMAISFLLEHFKYTAYEPALKQALLSLDCMINGGIYDQLGGGFARYSTDREWLAPHFEKMLYDNALIVLSLCDAYSVTKDEKYRRVIEDTIAFVERELKEENGGYFSALDADSEGVEGKYYTWTWEEWTGAMGEDNELLTKYWNVRPEGNWEHTNILHVTMPLPEVAASLGMTTEEAEKKLRDTKEKLFNEREKKIRPITDDKSLLSWNALMNLAVCKAGIILGNDKYLTRAREHMQWMIDRFTVEGELMHAWKSGQARIPAKLDDYAYLMQAMLQLASATGENSWINKASALAETVSAQFLHEEGNFFYYSSERQKHIPVRKVELYDGATPSANAVMAHNLLLLGMCMERSDWLEHAAYMVQQMAGTTARYVYSFAYWAMLMQRYANGPKTVVCAGDDKKAISQALLQKWIPHCYVINIEKEIFEVPLLTGKKSKEDLLIFVCTQQACFQPVSGIEETLHLIYR